MTTQPANTSRQQQVRRVLARQRPDRIVYAPNCWQWFAHQLNHGLLPPELAHCHTQLDLIKHLGLDVFSRNVYCDQQHCWFGGLAEEVWDGVEAREEVRIEGRDRVITKTYATRRGTLTERQRYVFADSTLVQEVFTLDDVADPLGALEELLRARRWRFRPERYAQEQARVGDDGLVVAGELHSPLKALHFLAGAVNATYLISDDEARVRELLALHEAAQLDLARQMAAAGAPAMMAMDNLDAAFHTPAYVEKFSASFYEKASRIAHDHGSTFFIHACGRQRANLKFIDSLGVDGLEGVARALDGGWSLILMDMSLPEIDGWEATRRIRAAGAAGQTPIIALTAHAMSGDRDKAIEAGCNDYDTKPVDLERLLGKMTALGAPPA